MNDYRAVAAMTIKAPDERTARRVISAILASVERGSSKAYSIEHVELIELKEEE
jgi:hypothetical protein